MAVLLKSSAGEFSTSSEIHENEEVLVGELGGNVSALMAELLYHHTACADFRPPTSLGRFGCVVDIIGGLMRGNLRWQRPWSSGSPRLHGRSARAASATGATGGARSAPPELSARSPRRRQSRCGIEKQRIGLRARRPVPEQPRPTSLCVVQGRFILAPFRRREEEGWNHPSEKQPSEKLTPMMLQLVSPFWSCRLGA